MERLGRWPARMALVYPPFILDCPELWVAKSRRGFELRGAAALRPRGVAQKQDAKHPDGSGNYHWDSGGDLCRGYRKSGAGAGRATAEQFGRQLCVDLGGRRSSKKKTKW